MTQYPDPPYGPPPAYGPPPGAGPPAYSASPVYGASAPGYGYPPPAYGPGPAPGYGSAADGPAVQGAGPPPAPGYGPVYGAWPPPGYPPPTYGYRPPPPRVEVGQAWKWAWSRLGQNMVLVGGPLLCVVAVLATSIPLAVMAGSLEPPLDDWFAICFLLLGGLALLHLSVGAIHASLVAARGERVHLRDFVVFPNAWRAMVVLVICEALTLLGSILLGVGSWFAAYFCAFAVLIALDQKTSVLRSISLSFSMMKEGIQEGMIPLLLVSRMAMGAISYLIIPVVVTVPAGNLMEAYAYTRLAASAPAAPEQGWG